MRILVVEDDKELNRQISEALTDAGYVVDKAFDGEEGHYLGETEPSMRSCWISACRRWPESALSNAGAGEGTRCRC